MYKYEDIKLQPSEAYDMYVEKYPDTTVIEIELELKSGTYLYKVKGFDNEKEYKIYINPYTKEITEVTEKISHGMFTQIIKDHTNQIDELVDQAMKDAGDNSKLEEWSLEIDEGKLELKVEINLPDRDDLKYKYNLNTKELIKKK